MNLTSIVDRVAHWYATRPTHTKMLLALATTVLIVELILRRVARTSRVYALWTRAFVALGHVWSLVILTIMYVVAIGPVGIGMRLFGSDPLDRGLTPKPSFWHAHEPNPLGVRAASRYQF